MIFVPISRLTLLCLAILMASAAAFPVGPRWTVSPVGTVGSAVGTVGWGARTISTAVSAGAPATLEPPVKEKVKEVEKEDTVQDAPKHKKGGWALRLINDARNKREYVALCLCKIVGLSDGQAYQVMMQAHQNGVSVIGRFDLERAELYRDKLSDNGLTVDMIPVEDD